MAEMTPDRLAELRRIAEAATPGPLTMHLCDDARYAAFVDAPHLGPDAPELAVFLIERDARFFAEFDRDTVLAMLDEIERLRREREVLAEAVMGWQRYLERDVGTEIVHIRTLEAHGGALALLSSEKGGGGDV